MILIKASWLFRTPIKHTFGVTDALCNVCVTFLFLTMSTFRQSKRKRLEPDSSNPGVPSKSKYVYIDDGNVILEADLVQFRVHRSMLSSQSTVFADMFTLPQPQNDVTVDDCPIVHLSDSAKDVEYLLRAIYYGRCAK